MIYLESSSLKNRYKIEHYVEWETWECDFRNLRMALYSLFASNFYIIKRSKGSQDIG